jgi:hypothetical protein
VSASATDIRFAVEVVNDETWPDAVVSCCCKVDICPLAVVKDPWVWESWEFRLEFCAFAAPSELCASLNELWVELSED